MQTEFRIDLKWVEAAGARSMARHFLAEIGIEAGGVTLTSSFQGSGKRGRSRMRVSAYDLAAWFVTNWWRLRWESEGAGHSWKMSHCMGAVGNGYLWPDIEISGGQDSVRVHATPIIAEPASQFRFLDPLDRLVPAVDFENAVRELVGSVTKRLNCPTLHGPDDVHELASAWEVLQLEILDQDAAFLRSLEARMGFEPEEADAALLKELKESTHEVGSGAVEEMATASKDAALNDLRTLLTTVPTGGQLLTLGTPDSLTRAAADSKRTQAQPWKQGIEVARAARREWVTGDDGLDDRRLAEICGVRKNWIRERVDVTGPMPAGIRDPTRSNDLKALLNKRHPNGRRFALARIMGDHIMAGSSERLLPITGSHTLRQQFQRAFATEFLCPIESLKEFIGNSVPDDDLLDDASLKYQVSPVLIERTLNDNGLLPRPTWPT